METSCLIETMNMIVIKTILKSLKNESIFIKYTKLIIMNNTASISQWASIRLAVGAAMFITYTIFYAAYYFSQFQQNR